MNTKKLAMWAASLLGLALLAWAARPQPQAVETARPARGYFVRELVEDAQTRVRERYTVSAPLAGQLLRPVLKAGDAVAAGDTVALIEPAPATFLEARSQGEQRERVAAMQATLDRALANQTRARAAERQAQADHARSQSLAEQGFVSSTQLENTALACQPQQPRRPHAVAGRVLKLHRDSKGPVTAGAALLDIGDPGQSPHRPVWAMASRWKSASRCSRCPG